MELQKQLELKNKQLIILQNKLDSQDIIINDYYLIKDKYNESKMEICNLKKIIEKNNSNISSMNDQLNQKEIEIQNIKDINIGFCNEIKDLKKKLNIFFSSENKLNQKINEYKKQDLLLKNIQTENEILNSKILNLKDIEKKSEKVINDLKELNNKNNIEKDNLLRQINDFQNKMKIEEFKNNELIEVNRVLTEEKKKLIDENNNINLELKKLKNNINSLEIQNKNISDDLNQKSLMLSKLTIKNNEIEKDNNIYKEKIESNNQIIEKENEKNKKLEKSIDDIKKEILK